MGENSKIEWTDHTWNPWIGCSKVSPACANCYAERDFDQRRHFARWGPEGTRVLTSQANWQKPLKWNRDVQRSFETAQAQWVQDCCVGYKSYLEPQIEQYRQRVFCASLADVFEDWQGPIGTHDGGRVMLNPDSQLMAIDADAERTPSGSRFATIADIRLQLFDLIDRTPNLDWLLLTKRPQNILRMWPDDKPRQNVWLGTSVENQRRAEERIPELLKCHHLTPVRFLSCEPLLGSINLSVVGNHDGTAANLFDGNALYVGDIGGADFAWTPRGLISWVIAGGESGPNARPTDPEWFRSLRDQCVAARVPFLFKQWGEFGPDQVRVGKKNAGRELDGRLWDEFPA